MGDSSRTFTLTNNDSFRSVFVTAYRFAQMLAARGAVELIVQSAEDIRSLSQNRKLWPMLTDISRQLVWPVNGRIGLIAPEDWKDILSAELSSEQRVAQGIGGGFVMLGMRTSKLKKRQFSDLIEIIYAFGSSHGVTWSEKALEVYETYREAQAA